MKKLKNLKKEHAKVEEVNEDTFEEDDEEDLPGMDIVGPCWCYFSEENETK